jgi:hypothetical protein
MKRFNKNANSSYRRTNNNYRSSSSSLKASNKFNMLNALAAFSDTNFRRQPDLIKVRAVLKTTVIRDDQGNEYSREEAAQLLAEALLEGRGINFYLFQNEDGSYGGNGRINILELESASASSSSKSKPKATTLSKSTATKAKVTKRNYEQLVDDEDEDEQEDDDDEFVDDTDIDNLDEDELNQLIDAF